MSIPTGNRKTISQLRFLACRRWLGCFLALAIGSWPTTAGATDEGRPVKIIFRGLQCYQETNEAGSDSPYLYVYAANLRTGEFRSSGGAFIDVDEDELRQCTELSADWPEVMTANELIIVMCLREDDTDDEYNYPQSSTDEAVLYMAYRDVLQMKASYEKKLTDIVLAERANYQPTGEFHNRVASALLELLPDTSSSWGDDTIGRSELRLADDDISGKTIDKEVAILGDGGAYKIYFDVHSGNATLKPGLKGIGPMVGGAVRNLAGSWQSSLGPVDFQQDGYKVAGVVHFPDGVDGRVSATLDGDVLRCKWYVQDNNYGEARLKIDPAGNRLAGTFQSSVDPSFKGEWTVTRAASQPGLPPPKTNLAGTWQSNLGPVDFQQDNYKVSAVVHFPDGVKGHVSATIDGNTLRCKWYVQDNNHGVAQLNIDPSGSRLEGTFQSSVDPNFKGQWTMTRGGQSPTPPIPPPKSPPAASFAGSWQSNLGPVDLQQDGFKISGVVHFPNGVDGRVSATIDGDMIRCKWYVHDNHHGEALLKISPDGHHLDGSFQSQVDPNFKGPWALHR
jgi:uncharacterized protein YodC (DUF2158 family)